MTAPSPWACITLRTASMATSKVRIETICSCESRSVSGRFNRFSTRFHPRPGCSLHREEHVIPPRSVFVRRSAGRRIVMPDVSKKSSRLSRYPANARTDEESLEVPYSLDAGPWRTATPFRDSLVCMNGLGGSFDLDVSIHEYWGLSAENGPCKKGIHGCAGASGGTF